MKLTHLVCAAAVLAGAAPAARADTTATSTITQIKMNGPGDDKYKLFHGSVWLDYDKEQHNYRWGGRHCNGAGLQPEALQLLYTAFRDRLNVTIEYRLSDHKDKQFRCLTGFTITR